MVFSILSCLFVLPSCVDRGWLLGDIRSSVATGMPNLLLHGGEIHLQLKHRTFADYSSLSPSFSDHQTSPELHLA